MIIEVLQADIQKGVMIAALTQGIERRARMWFARKRRRFTRIHWPIPVRSLRPREAIIPVPLRVPLLSESGPTGHEPIRWARRVPRSGRRFQLAQETTPVLAIGSVCT